MKPMHLIWNPASGAGFGEKAYRTVTALLDKKGIPYVSHRTERKGHPTELASNAVSAGAETVIVFGGDGSIREAGVSLVHTDTVMGIIPCGSGNDLVRTLKIPTDPAKALDVILSGSVRNMDAGSANGKTFLNVSGFGFDVDVLGRDRELRAKGFRGGYSYTISLLGTLKNLPVRKVRLTCAETSAEYDSLIVAVGNGAFFGGGMHITPGADVFDGKFNVCIVHDVNRLNILPTLLKFASGRHVDLDYVDYFQTSELTCECDPVSDLELDGEIMPGTPVTYKVLPGALKVFVPGKKNS